MGDRSSFDRWRPHPWHDLSAGADPPGRVGVSVEITPFDSIKYEIDEESGYLRADGPQRTSALPPAADGFIARSYCGPKVAAPSKGSERGDGDPMDICVFSERPIDRVEVLLDARVVGGRSLVDDGAADDEVIAILEGDAVWGRADDIPGLLIERLRHDFATYKLTPGGPDRVEVGEVYGRSKAERVVAAALDDDRARFGPESCPEIDPDPG